MGPKPSSLRRTSERIVRVFLSSTFRDMQAERDHLVKVVFPELRDRCRDHLVDLVEVDLRWGIPKEKEAQILRICLEEIEVCRPYFVGILGERYGSIPVSFSPIAKDPRFRWVKRYHGEASVTELEILHGVLNNPAMENRAFFYFRDPEVTRALAGKGRGYFLESASPEEVNTYGRKVAEGRAAERRKRLLRLKDKIRKGGFFPKIYRTPRELGTEIIEDLWSSIAAEWGEFSPRDELDRQSLEHESFGRSRSRAYVPIPGVFEVLDRHALGRGAPLVITGVSGVGKSALLANWAFHFRDHNPEQFIVLHFVCATPESAEVPSILRRILGEIRKRYDLPRPLPGSEQELYEVFPVWLDEATCRGRMVIVLDAMNQIRGQEWIRLLDSFPDPLPSNIRLIGSALPGLVLDGWKSRGWKVHVLRGLEVAERREAIKKYLYTFRKEAERPVEDRLANAGLASNPLYLRAVMEELRVFGVDYEKVGEYLDGYLSAVTIPDLYGMILDRYEKDYDPGRRGRVQDALSLIWASPRGGLYESEIRELLGSFERPLPNWVWSPLYLALRESLVNRAGVLGFFHDYLREAIESKYLASREEMFSAYRRLADYFSEKYSRPGGNATYRGLSLAAAREAVAVAEQADDNLCAEACMTLAGSLVSVGVGVSHDSAERFREAAEVARKGCEIARNCGKLDTYADGLAHRACTSSGFNTEFGDYRLLDEAVAIRRKIHDRDGLRDTLFDKAKVALWRQEWGIFDKAMREASRIHGDIRRKEDMEGRLRIKKRETLFDAHLAQVWGEAFVQRGQPKKATTRLEKARRICRKRKYLLGVCAAEGWMGLALARLGQIEKGLHLVRKSLGFERDVLGSGEGAAKWLHWLGELFEEFQEPERAQEAYRLAEGILEENGHASIKKTQEGLSRLRSSSPRQFRQHHARFDPWKSEFGEFAFLWGIGPFHREVMQPILDSRPNSWESLGVSQPTTWTDGEKVFLLYCAKGPGKKGRGTISRIGLAISTDGLHFEHHPDPVLEPTLQIEDGGGCEDPRLAWIGDTHFLTYTANNGEAKQLTMAYAKGSGSLKWEKIGRPLISEAQRARLKLPDGIISDSCASGGVIYPEQIQGYYWMFFGDHVIYAAVSRDLDRWEVIEDPILTPRAGFFDSCSVGTGPPPVQLSGDSVTRRPEGIWLGYNAARMIGKEFRYGFGGVLLDPGNPMKILRRTPRPLIPAWSTGHREQVLNRVSASGLVQFKGKWFLYLGYGKSGVRVEVADGNHTDCKAWRK